LSESVKPIFLLADSQLLFWRNEEGRYLLDRAREMLLEGDPEATLKAAYLGASNGDVPEFYELFVAAMAEVGIRKCRHIPAEPSSDDLEALDQAHLILLAGGDTLAGWRAFQAAGLPERLSRRYYEGAVLVGISAGAVQLGLKGREESANGDAESGASFETLRLVPFVIDVHDEPTWGPLHGLVQGAGELTRGYGIPSGGGAVYHPDYSLEPVRHPVTEIELRDGLRTSIVLPGAGGEPQPETPRILSEEEVLRSALRELGDGHDEPDERVH
jgi:hypothetical protein